METINKVTGEDLGKALKPYLELPYFQGWTQENLRPLAAVIFCNLQKARRKAKKAGYPNPDEPIEDIAHHIVHDVVVRLYPEAVEAMDTPTTNHQLGTVQPLNSDTFFLLGTENIQHVKEN